MPRRASGCDRPAFPVARRTTWVVLALLGLACPLAADATGPDVALQEQVKALSAVVERLQARVDQLERQASAAAATASGVLPAPPVIAGRQAGEIPAALSPDARPADASPRAQLRSHWAKIGPGLTSAEVTALLGEPTRRMTLDGRTAWYYVYPTLGNGSVFFTGAGRVSSHQSPFAWGD